MIYFHPTKLFISFCIVNNIVTSMKFCNVILYETKIQDLIFHTDIGKKLMQVINLTLHQILVPELSPLSLPLFSYGQGCYNSSSWWRLQLSCT